MNAEHSEQTPRQRLLVHDGSFAVLDPAGDISGAPGATPDGLFLRDVRHLSRWRLTLDAEVPSVLVPAPEDRPAAPDRGAGAPDGRGCADVPDAGVPSPGAVLTPGGTREEPPAYTVFREQALAAGELVERIDLANNTGHRVTTALELLVDADFADQFELRSDRRTFAKPDAERTTTAHADGLTFDYRRADWHTRTSVTAEPPPDRIDPVPETASATAATSPGSARRLSWTLELPPHSGAELRLQAAATGPDTGNPAVRAADPAGVRAQQAAETAAFTADGPDPRDLTDRPRLAHACARGLADLATLRVTADGPDGETLRVPGAGVPWFLTLFGRDSLLTSLFALPYRPALAEATLLALAATQARDEEPERLAEPGKVVHELRHGELAHFGQVPYGRYYGSVDATPLFLVLLGSYAEQTPDGAGSDLARRLEGPARAAVRWMFRHGGLDTHGYLAYEAHRGGLANQSWKDSPGAICSADGSHPAGAVLVSEVQGYAYDALRHTARLARTVWADTEYADRLEREADALRRRFAADFWLPGQRFPALALDSAGRVADALASDAGHLLWSGILEPAAGEAVGRRLLRPDFFSGWGVRTLAAGQDAYHPLSYHRGSVWPHDNAVIALGLARYGLYAQARTVTGALLEAAARHGYRLPEVFAGYGRDRHPAPVPYPHSCVPQAWAAAAPLALLTAVRRCAG